MYDQRMFFKPIVWKTLFGIHGLCKDISFLPPNLLSDSLGDAEKTPLDQSTANAMPNPSEPAPQHLEFRNVPYCYMFKVG